MNAKRWWSILALITLIHLSVVGVWLRQSKFTPPQWVAAQLFSTPSETADDVLPANTQPDSSAVKNAIVENTQLPQKTTAFIQQTTVQNEGLKALASAPINRSDAATAAQSERVNTNSSANKNANPSTNATINTDAVTSGGAGREGSAAAPSDVLTLPTHIGGHLHNPQPPYPELSRDAGEQGVVTLSVMVEPDGRASAVDVVKGSGYGRLDRAAHDTVLKQYRFIPARRGEQAIAYRYRFSVVFRLQSN